MNIRFVRTLSLMVVLALAVLGVVRASLDRFQQKRDAIFAAAKAERERLGITSREVLVTQYPTPEITLGNPACMTPGATMELVVKGRFKPGTKFLLRSDRLEVLTENVSATEYRATIKAPADMGPEQADLEAFTPVSAARAVKPGAVVISGKYEWDLKVENGWRIKALLLEDTRCTQADGYGTMKYALDFFRGTETKPFEKRTATLYHSPYEKHQYRFAIDQPSYGGEAQKEMEEIAKKFQSGNLSEAEMTKLMARIQELQEQLQAEMTKMTDPNYLKQLEAKKQEFGCESIHLQLTGFQCQGELSCSEKVGRDLAVTGTVKFLGK